MEKTNELRDQKQIKVLFLGIGSFVTGFSLIRLALHYWFGVTIGGYSRKFGYYDESLYWLFLVIGVVWLIYSIISYWRFRKQLQKQ